MSTDDYGTEYIYPPAKWGKSLSIQHERISAQDERFASVNEAIGLLDYKLEQHITQCADGLAPLADFISASWAVIDELVTRIEQLEAAQPIPTIARAATIDENGVLVSHDAWDAMERELNELRAFKAGVPWDALVQCASGAGNVYGASSTDINAAFLWLDANAPKEPTE